MTVGCALPPFHYMVCIFTGRRAAAAVGEGRGREETPKADARTAGTAVTSAQEQKLWYEIEMWQFHNVSQTCSRFTTRVSFTQYILAMFMPSCTEGDVDQLRDREIQELRSQLTKSVSSVADYAALRRELDQSEKQRAQLSDHIQVSRPC